MARAYTGAGSLLLQVNEGPDGSLLRAIQPTPMADSESAVSELAHVAAHYEAGFLRSVDLDDWSIIGRQLNPAVNAI